MSEKNDSQNEGLLDKSGLADRLKCTTRTIENLMAERRIPFIRLGRKLVRFDWEKVKAHLNLTAISN